MLFTAYYQLSYGILKQATDGNKLSLLTLLTNVDHCSRCSVQIMGSRGLAPSLPPPYSTAPRGREEGGAARGLVRGGERGPPPPYISSEDIAEGGPLLGEEDGNNNGDINGRKDRRIIDHLKCTLRTHSLLTPTLIGANPTL